MGGGKEMVLETRDEMVKAVLNEMSSGFDHEGRSQKGVHPQEGDRKGSVRSARTSKSFDKFKHVIVTS